MQDGNPALPYCLPQHQHLARTALAKVSPVLLAHLRVVLLTLCAGSYSGSWLGPLLLLLLRRRGGSLLWPLSPRRLGLSLQPLRPHTRALNPGPAKVGGGLNWRHVPLNWTCLRAKLDVPSGEEDVPTGELRTCLRAKS